MKGGTTVPAPKRAPIHISHYTKAALARQQMQRRRLNNAVQIAKSPSFNLYRTMGFNNPIRVCAARKLRRAVLLSKGKVNKPGGAPGGKFGYRRTAKSKIKC